MMYKKKPVVIEAADELERLEKINRNLRNELCLRCGRYREAHKGACDGCRWNEVSV